MARAGFSLVNYRRGSTPVPAYGVMPVYTTAPDGSFSFASANDTLRGNAGSDYLKPSIIDVSGQLAGQFSPGRVNKVTGQPLGPLQGVNGIVTHWTGDDRDTVGGVLNTFKTRDLVSQFVVDRDGTVYQTMPDGSQGWHVSSKDLNSKIPVSNLNSIGIEFVGKTPTDAQKAAAPNLFHYLTTDPAAAGWGAEGLTSDKVYGHGQINPGHKEEGEGIAFQQAIQSAYPPPTAVASADAKVSGVAPAADRPMVYGLQGQSHMTPAEDAAFKASGQKWAAARGADFTMVPRTIDGKTDNKELQAQWVQDHVKPGDPKASLYAFSAGVDVADKLANRIPGSIERVVGAGGPSPDVTQASFAQRGIAATLDNEHSIDALQKVAGVSAQAEAAAAPVARTPGAGNVLQEQSSAKTRTRALSAPTVAMLQAGADAAGVDFRVFSGAQAAFHNPLTKGKDWTGSHRHDQGPGVGAADGFIVDRQTGRKLSMDNAQDLPRIKAFMQGAVGAGATGVGGGEDYMQPDSFHVGGGKGAPGGGVMVWGKDGATANADPRLQQMVAGLKPGQPVEATGAAQDAATRGVGGGYKREINSADMDTLTRTVLAEARGEGHDGMQGVAEVALNRYNDADPNQRWSGQSLGSILTGGKHPEFAAPMASGFTKEEYANAQQAVKDALQNPGVAKGSTYFFNPKTADPAAAAKITASGQQLAAVGNHVFYGTPGAQALGYAPQAGAGGGDPQISWGHAHVPTPRGIGTPLATPVSYDQTQPPAVASAYPAVQPPAVASAYPVVQPPAGGADEASGRATVTPTLPAYKTKAAPYNADAVVRASLANDPAALKAAWDGVRAAATAHPPMGAVTNLFKAKTQIQEQVGKELGGYFSGLPPAVQQQMALNAHNNPELISATPEEGRQLLTQSVADIMSGMGSNPQSLTSPVPLPTQRPNYTSPVQVASVDPVVTSSVRTVGDPAAAPQQFGSMVVGGGGMADPMSARSGSASYPPVHYSNLDTGEGRQFLQSDHNISASAPWTSPSAASQQLYHAEAPTQAVIVNPAATATTFAKLSQDAPQSLYNPPVAYEQKPALDAAGGLTSVVAPVEPGITSLGSEAPAIAAPPGMKKATDAPYHPLYNPYVRSGGQLAGFPGVPQSAFSAGIAAQRAGYGTTPTHMLSALFGQGYSMPNFTPGGGGAVFAYKPGSSSGGSGYTDVHGNWQSTGSYVDSHGTQHSYDMG